MKTLKSLSLINPKNIIKAFIVYVALKCLIEKIDESKNNPENSSTTKIGKHIASGFSISTISSFKTIKNKHNVYIP